MLSVEKQTLHFFYLMCVCASIRRIILRWSVCKRNNNNPFVHCQMVQAFSSTVSSVIL